MIGRRLSGRYEIRQLMGEGGMAVVYQAVDTLLDRRVAVKLLRPEFSHDEDFIRRFRREARAAAQLSHPNIVQVYDVGQDNGLDYIVMECVAGRTLEQKIRAEGALPVAEAVDLARQVLEALRHAHEHGVIHRDIKPQNILLTTTGQVKVTDFGIARAVGAATLAKTDTIMGSAHYISPEQARGRHTGVQSDLYSLGVVLFEMLTGTRPFDGETAVTVAVKHLQEEIPSPRALNPEIPPTLECIIFKALSKEVSRRYACADDFLSDLARYRTASPHELIAGQVPVEHTRVLGPVSLDEDLMGAAAVAGPASVAATTAALPRPGRRWRNWVLALAVVGVLVGGASYAAYLVRSWLFPPLVEVPPLVGVNVDEAAEDLAERGVELRILHQRYDNERPAGVILWQDPPAGQQVKQGGVVDVIISRGPQWVQGGVP
ncbi:MAG TPA: Stk1 family PASTA domain-containing Ser/Thr kinase, partial [Bacillota bacterium]